MALDNFLNRIRNIYSFDPSTSIPSLSDKTIIITGANAGLGLESAIQLAARNPQRLILTTRSRAKYDVALSKILERVPNARSFTHFQEMDLSSLSSVKSAAENLLSELDGIDVLMNNAGVMGAAASLTEDGYEVHFGTNHMGHALLTELLMPLLLKTAKQKSGTGTAATDIRIVNVSSGAYQTIDTATGGFSEALVKTDMASHRGTNGNLLSRYGQSKLANILHAKGLAEHYPAITSVAIAPGRVKTDLLNGLNANGNDRFYAWFQWFYDLIIGAHSVVVGAYTQVWAATDPERSHVQSGEMYFPVGKRDEGTKYSNDKELVERLWKFTTEELRSKGFL